jgi:hypothetical protein
MGRRIRVSVLPEVYTIVGAEDATHLVLEPDTPHTPMCRMAIGDINTRLIRGGIALVD